MASVNDSGDRATYRIVTPMFCGGAEQQAEFRLASCKGVLRFWWRALEWGRIQDLAQLYREEAELFGSSQSGQASFLMRLEDCRVGPANQKKNQLSDNGSLVGQGARYLGYGAMEAYGSRKKGTRDAELTRECLPPGGEIILALRFNSSATEQQRFQVGRALTVAGLLGGMGSKSRKGYGSLVLSALTSGAAGSAAWHAPRTMSEFRDQLLGLLRSALGGQLLPNWHDTPLTAFSKDSRIVLIAGRTGDTALQFLDRIGRELVRYRSWGRNGQVLGNVPREGNFQGDHELMKQDWRQRTTHPKRIAFGLPHNYGKAEQHLDVTPADEALDRRASPLFIHIHQAEGSPPLGVLTFLPGLFLPLGRDGISVGGRSVPLQTRDLWKPVEDFLDRLLNPSLRKEFTPPDQIEELEVSPG